MLCYTLSPEPFENIMHHFMTMRRSFSAGVYTKVAHVHMPGAFIVAVVVFLVTSVVFVPVLMNRNHRKRI